MRQAGDIKWCDIEGLPCTVARQQDLKSVQNTKNGIQKTSASDVVFRDPYHFVAGELHNPVESWNFVLEEYRKRDKIIKYLADGVSIFDFMKPFNGEFKGVKYNSPTPFSIILPNSKSCNDFEEFISRTIIERVSNGSLAVWGKKGDCTPPHLIMPMTIKPSKPRLCHDERFLNLWTKGPLICFDPITDLPAITKSRNGEYCWGIVGNAGESRGITGNVGESWLIVRNTRGIAGNHVECRGISGNCGEYAKNGGE